MPHQARTSRIFPEWAMASSRQATVSTTCPSLTFLKEPFRLVAKVISLLIPSLGRGNDSTCWIGMPRNAASSGDLISRLGNGFLPLAALH